MRAACGVEGRVHDVNLRRFGIDAGVAEILSGDVAHIDGAAVELDAEEIVVAHLIGCVRRLHAVG
jgi:hypothetical protein